MVLDALMNQLSQRFQHEKRAQVCLWFDERNEFARLLDAFDEHLAAMIQAPFRLLRYDYDQGHGQVWIKYQIHRALAAAGPELRASLRFVVYLPVPEERLDQPGPAGEPPLDLLTEYRIGGSEWRINGKRPTLFALLRQAGAALPSGVGEQRRLYEGGQDSVLAKYVGRFVDRPAQFWSETLTPALAQSRLLGDLDRTLLDLGVDPESAWKALGDDGLWGELIAAVRERYGFEYPTDSLDDWVRELVAVLALTETYIGYGEPAEFPFMTRLPPLGLRPHHLQLLQRWLRDSEGRGAWDRWILEVEHKLDLTAWAQGRPGCSFGFPHLVRLRWDEVRQAFDAAASKSSAVDTFFQDNGDLIQRECEYAKASSAPVGAWSLLRDLGTFLGACGQARSRAEQATGAAALARVYVEAADSVERQHVRLRARAEEEGLPAVTRVLDRCYGAYANVLNNRFFKSIADAASVAIPGIPPVTGRLEKTLWSAKGKRAVVIVDALRYDCALALRDALRGHEVEVEPLVATLPTVTAVGMTALLPLGKAAVTLAWKGNTVQPLVNGKDTSVRANRLDWLSAFGAVCRDIAELDGYSEPPIGLGDLLVVSGHDEVDSIGHGEAQTLIRHLQIEVERLARLVRKLHRWGFEQVHVVTDHGFILLDEEQLPEEMPCEKDWCHVRKERYALVPASADLPLATFPCAWDASVRIAVPPGLAFFMAEKSFSHGGAAVQELIIPHLTSKSYPVTAKRIGVEVVMPTTQLVRTAVKVILRPKAGPAGHGQMSLFAETGRTLTLDVRRYGGTAAAGTASVLASGPKDLRLEPQDQEQTVTLFFHTAASFKQGELFELDIRDNETTEQFPSGGIKLSVGRDM